MITDRGIDVLGLSTRTFRFLSARGVRSVSQLLALPPAELVTQASRWDEIADALARLADRQPELKSAVIAYLDAGWAAAERKRHDLEERRANDPDTGLSLLERAVVQLLRGQAHPMPLRVVRREIFSQFKGQTLKLRETVNACQSLVSYPYGRHNWIGLAEWGAEGYRKAARAAWTVLPVHLSHIIGSHERESLTPPAVQAIIDVALERRDPSIMLLCQELFETPAPSVFQPVELAESTEPTDEIVNPAALVAQPEPEPVMDPPLAVAETPAKDYQPAPPRAEKVPAELKATIDAYLGKGKPNLFGSLAHDKHPKEAIQRMVEKAEKLEPPFSLAELRPNPHDYVWLRKWARELPPYVARGYLHSTYHDIRISPGRWSSAECFGGLLLFLASEVARRDAQEGRLWDVVCAAFTEQTREELFANGHPRAETKAAIEAGARQLGVHHAFGREGTQSWYVTTYLQFGFTRNGVVALGSWLSHPEHTPQACLQLKDESPTFADLWAKMGEFRRRRLPEASLRSALSSSPFVLPELVDAIVAAIPPGRMAELEGEESDEAVYGALGPPKVLWDGGRAPEWEAEFLPLDHLQLRESIYEVQLDGHECSRLLLQAGDLGTGYKADPPTVRRPLHRHSLEVALLDEAGEDDRELVYEVWDSAQDVTVFDASTGQRCSPGRSLSQKKGLFLLLARGLSLSNASTHRSHEVEQGFTLVELEAGWSTDTAVHDAEGRCVFLLVESPAPSWVDLVAVSAGSEVHRLEAPVRMRVHGLPADAVLTGARCSGQALEVQEYRGSYEVTLQLPPSHPGPTVALQLQVSYHGKTYRIRRSTTINLFDASICLAGQWQRFHRMNRLCRSELSRASCRIFLADKEFSKPKDWALLEGDMVAQRPRNGVFLLGDFHGYGAPLFLKPGPYNQSDSLAKPLLSAVVSSGIVKAYSATGRVWRIELNRKVIGDETYSVIFWDGSDQLATCPGKKIDFGDGLVWSGPLPTVLTGREEVAVAVARGGVLAGSSWNKELEFDVESPNSATVAGLLRWFRFPILHKRWFARVQKLAVERMSEALWAWLCGLSPPGHPELRYPEQRDDGWNAAIRTIYRGCNPSSEAFVKAWHQLVEAMDGAAEPERSALQLLVRSAPAVALKLLEGHFEGQSKLQEAWEFVLDGAEEDALASQAAKDMECGDKAFPLGLCKRVANNVLNRDPLSGLDSSNLALAYQSEPFSRLFVAVFLKEKLARIS